jgi:hypothetical protein
MNNEQTTGPSAKVICDSINEWGQRLTTMEVRMHRFILAEMNTHRVFSRNSASSRAIPFTKIRDKLESGNYAVPVYWGEEKPGMQPGPYVSAELETEVRDEWDRALEDALYHANNLFGMRLHKSLINRLLEPFMWHIAIITATEWDNFFWQRCHPDAQPEMQAVANEMQRAYYLSTPRETAHGDWHCPYIHKEDVDEAYDTTSGPGYLAVEILKQVSTARCARVSYLTHDGKRSLDADLELFHKLRGSGHWSPFEHVATPVTKSVHDPSGMDGCGNFVGWRQYRKEFQNENRKNFIPNLPDVVEELLRRANDTGN